MSIPVPWGAYIVGHPNNTSTSLYDFTENGRNATMSGVTLTSGSGNGATVPIPFLTGGISSKITWPAGSIPTTFTICSIARYIAGGWNRRIFDGSGLNWLHGNYEFRAGVAFYGKWVTQNTNTNFSPITSWSVVCGTNGTSVAVPNNVLVNGVGYGTDNGGTGGGRLTINNGSAIAFETTDFAFQQVLIWDSALTAAQMSTVSTLMSNYLSYGSITYPWTGGPTYSLNQNYVFGKFDTTYTVLNQVLTSGTVYTPSCISSNGKNMISFQGTWPNMQTYYSNNYGSTWALSNMPSASSQMSVSCSPLNFPNVFYIGSAGTSKLYRSADGGATWTLISTVIANAGGICVNDSDTILYVSGFGVAMFYATKPGNTNFNYATNTGTFSLTQITGSNNAFQYTDIRCSPDGTFLYGSGSSSNRAFKYNFTNTSSFVATLLSTYNVNICSVAMSSNGRYLYAALYLSASYALVRSTDNGATFSDITGALITKNSACLVYCDPTGQYVQVTYNTSWWVSSNYGTTFTVYSGGAIPNAPRIFNNNQFVALITNTASTQYGPLSNPSYPYLNTTARYVVSGSNSVTSPGNGFIAYSNDGQSWTQSSSAKTVFAYNPQRIASNGSMFVATCAGISSGSSNIGYSYDGDTWYQSANGNSILSNYAIGLAYGNGIWVAGGSGAFSIAYSYDGINWTGAASSTFFGSTAAIVGCIVYENSMWVATAYGGPNQAKIAYSTNGISWTLITDTTLNNFVQGVEWNGTYWVAVGNNSTNTAQIIYSPTLTGTWTSPPGTSTIFGGAGSYGTCIVWNGSYFLATNGNILARSVDGITWTTSNPPGFNATTLIWTGSFWISGGGYVSGYGTIMTSPDGVTWTATATNPAGTTASSYISGITKAVEFNVSRKYYNINNDKLLFYYPFDLNYSDYSLGYGVTNTNSLSNVSISTLNTKSDNGSLLLPGNSSQLVQLPNITFNTNGITIATWLKCNSIPINNSRVFDFGTGQAANNIALQFSSTGGGLLYMSFNPSSGTGASGTSTGYTLTDTNWHHYCIIISSSGVWGIYIDGVRLNVNLTSYPSLATLTKCYIGKSNWGSDTGYTNGYYSQFVIFNREITQTELSYLVQFPSQVQFSSNITADNTPPPCFKQGTRILTLDPESDQESYVPVETLQRGDLIKTSLSGYKAISFIGRATLNNPASDPDPNNRLYRFRKSSKLPELREDLYITGEHCTLRLDITEEHLGRIREHMGGVYITEKRFRCPACLDERAEQYDLEDSPVTIWHFALEHDNAYHNYGVYANGLLVETCSIEHLLKRSNMELV